MSNQQMTNSPVLGTHHQRNAPSPTVHHSTPPNTLRQQVNSPVPNSTITQQHLQHAPNKHLQPMNTGYYQLNESHASNGQHLMVNNAQSSNGSNNQQHPNQMLQVNNQVSNTSQSYNPHSGNILHANNTPYSLNHQQPTPSNMLYTNSHHGNSAMHQLNQSNSPHQSTAPSPSLSVKSQLHHTYSQPPQQLSSPQANGSVSNQSCYMPLPQKMRHISNGPLDQRTAPHLISKARPQTLYQQETPLQDYSQQNGVKKEMPQLRPDIYQRVPTLNGNDQYQNHTQYTGPVNSNFHNNYQTPPQPNSQFQNNFPMSQNQQVTAQMTKYSPYQHPPPPRQMENSKMSPTSTLNSSKNLFCNLCRKKQITSPAIYCADCDFYMSRFKQKT
jgi:hypothetical protein